MFDEGRKVASQSIGGYDCLMDTDHHFQPPASSIWYGRPNTKKSFLADIWYKLKEYTENPLTSPEWWNQAPCSAVCPRHNALL